jgi:transmembrane sensor
LLSVRAVPDVSDVVAWRERRLVFREQTLERIVAEFNRYNSRQMRLEGGGVASRVFTGVFDADDADSLAQGELLGSCDRRQCALMALLRGAVCK